VGNVCRWSIFFFAGLSTGIYGNSKFVVGRGGRTPLFTSHSDPKPSPMHSFKLLSGVEPITVTNPYLVCRGTTVKGMGLVTPSTPRLYMRPDFGC
jgi:hypothetical protein